MYFNGYKAAYVIDEKINGILHIHKITKANLKEWRTFTRTIRTTLDLIDNKIETIAAEGTEFARTEHGIGTKANG